ncbi:thiamine phosphate synthase [Clostridium sp. HCS.1]|uniref:thiamine phosphate synthase n=1 Tax=Clostridium sp. HCS.1 TaxID=3238594 RepID=UPI003A0FD69A
MLNLKLNKSQLLLYAVTDRAWLSNRTLEHDVEEALKGGVTILQLREKNLEEKDFLEEAININMLCKKYNVPFIVNDNVDIAIKCNADGVHVGQSDLNAETVRKIIGQDKILGVSAKNKEEALIAEKMGADYLGVGSIFTTSTKLDADYVSIEELKNICESVSIPVVAIGGISEENIRELKGSKIDGVAVVSAIFAKENIKEGTKEFIKITKEVILD